MQQLNYANVEIRPSGGDTKPRPPAEQTTYAKIDVEKTKAQAEESGTSTVV